MKRGRQFEHYLAKVALASGLALKEEKLRLFSASLASSQKCVACDFPVANFFYDEKIRLCTDNEYCQRVLKCTRPECPGVSHECFMCKKPACWDNDFAHAGHVIVCGFCEQPVCEECMSPCSLCAVNYTCRKCSPEPYDTLDRSWASEIQRTTPYCEEHLQAECKALAVLDACNLCADHNRNGGWISRCEECVGIQRTAVCPHTDRGVERPRCEVHQGLNN